MGSRRTPVWDRLVAGSETDLSLPSCADGKTFKKPRRPFEKERLDSELKSVGEYGLRNKRELWRVQAALSKIRKAARTLLTLDDKVLAFGMSYAP